MTRGNQRDLAREKQAKKQKDLSRSQAASDKGANKGLTLEQRKERDTTHTASSDSQQEKMDYDTEFDRDELPIRQRGDQLVRFIERRKTTILIGETGCGKSSQIPQLLYEHNLNNDMVIGITQPRRVAAYSLAMRVAKEMGVILGEEVGYSVRFDELASDATRIFYLTEGMLVREAMYGAMLDRYSIIILDEAHERTLQTDVLFAIVKNAQRARAKLKQNSLKIIIMSATMKVDKISAYFGHAQVAYCEGRMYPVQLYYAPQVDDDYFFNSLVTIFQIHHQKPYDGDILCFLTGQEEIDAAVAKCKEVLALTGDESVVVLPFYASLPPNKQLKIFKYKKNKKRKGPWRRIIIATNVAEASLTIPNVRYVIDCGKVKMKTYEPRKNIDMFRVVNASKAQVNQRSGRAGRQGPGQCYRLYSEDHYCKMADYTEAEVHRCSLATTCLYLLMLGVKDLSKFQLIEPPPLENVLSAYSLLYQLGAVKSTPGGDLYLSHLGRTMAALPVDTKFSRAILAAVDFKCSEEVIIIVALLSAGNVFVNNRNDKGACDFFSPEGDLIRLLKLFQFVRSLPSAQMKSWCVENYINYRVFSMAEKIHAQLRSSCTALNVRLYSCNGEYSFICQALCHGFFTQAAALDPKLKNGTYRVLSTGLKAKIHPSSCLFRQRPAYVLFNELNYTTRLYLRDVTVVDRESLEAFIPQIQF